MSKPLNDPSNADATLNESSEPIALELTPREIAIAEGRDPDEPESVEEVAEDEDVEDEPEHLGGEVADEQVIDPPAASAPWYSDTDRQYAEQHGISEWHLQQFASRDEFGKAAALLDAAEARRQTQAPAVPKASEPEETAEAEYVDEPVVNGKMNIEWFRNNGYDEATIKVLSHNDERLAYFESKFAEQDNRAQQLQRESEEQASQAQLNAFHEAASLLRPDFYGTTTDQHGNAVSLTKEQEGRRQSLFEEIYWHSQRMAYEQQQATGRVALPSWSALIKQVEPRAFGEELNRKTKDRQLAAAKAQARTIRPAAGSVGAGTARRASSPKTSETVEDIAQDPEVIEAWNRASPQNR